MAINGLGHLKLVNVTKRIKPRFKNQIEGKI